MKNCWICGSEDLSDEHKFKSSDMRKYGKHYKNDKAMFYIRGNEKHSVESYKSDLLKFKKIICRECNNVRTQTHDYAYDVLSKYIDKDNYTKLVDKRLIDFEDIFGVDWRTEKANLYRYYAKHAGCKIATSNKPHDLKEISDFILEKQNSITSFKLHFQLKEAIKILNEKQDNYWHLYNGSTFFIKENDDSYTFSGWISYQWLSVNWVMSSKITTAKKADLNRKQEQLSLKSIEEYSPFPQDFTSFITQVETEGIEDIQSRIKFIESIIDS
ncbi:hypothetical protein V9L05_09245 [Bernardetia sp. Wsw4-3y2]|uniref:hypothetical protein n=1 Tax=Bernardetia sp. Wsw4-3y2 TaxID=3127471 RepID=UPI0030D547F8